MEALGRMILVAVSGGLVFGFSVGTPVDISYLLFAHTFILCGVDPY
jgi:hypothetical protein